MRIVLIGCVKSSAYLLDQLISYGHSPVGVITKKESEFHADFANLMPLCQKADIPCISVKNINEQDSVDFIKACRPDILYCFGWSQLLKKHILDIPRLGAVGFHPAKLPNNRGRHPLIWALALGLTETASTFFMMDEQADSGAIISQVPVSITYEDDAASLYHKVLQAAGAQVLEFTEKFECGEVQPHVQVMTGNSWRKRGVQDGRIDWRMSGRAIYNLVRALARPYPGAHFDKNGEMIKIWRVKETAVDGFEHIECGKVLAVQSPTEFCVKAYDSVIQVLECEPVALEEGEYL